MSRSSFHCRLVVLQSVPQPRPTTNPYVIQLLESLGAVPDTSVLTFSWRTALRADYDIFHVHWPENLAKGHSPAKSFARRALTRLLLLRLRARRIPIVRTLHNIERPSGLSPADYRILDRIERATTLTIRLNDLTPITDGMPFETIPHGHYRNWFARYARNEPVPGRLGFFGLIRRYKNVAHLVAMATTLPSHFSLRVAGNPSTPDIAAEIVAAKGDDSRIVLDFHFLSDAELVDVVTESQLVVLPYSEMHNSGSVLAALSLGRPVLVQDNAVNRDLSNEVGRGWIHLYKGELEAGDVLAARDALIEHPNTVEPDLHLRDWEDAGERHVDAYRRALGIVRS